MQLMQFHSSNLRFGHDLRHFPSRKRSPFSQTTLFFSPHHCRCNQSWVSKIWEQGYKLHHNVARKPRSVDEGSLGISSLDDWGSNVGTSDYMIFSSDGEDSDGEILVTPINDVDMPTIKKQFVTAEDALTATAHRLAMLGRRHKNHRITYGFFTNLGLITFLTLYLAFADWCAWRIIRQPLDTFYFLSPFVASAFLVACAGYVSVPILKGFNIRQKFKRKWPPRHFSKKGTPTVGGLFFIPIGVAVAKVMSGSSTEVSGVLAVTLAFAAVGLLDDTLGLIKYQNYGLSGGTRIILEVAAAAWFSLWLFTKNISSPYAGGTSALTFVAMSVAVLPICSGVSVFGASMAGACVGFLLHNRYKASITMGNTGSFALGGALAAMAACSGMFIPLFIASGILVLETVAVIMQILYVKVTERIQGRGHCLFQIAPLHRHLESYGIREPFIVGSAYIISSLLAVCAGYVGLISA